jgi:hypothetical protein
MLDQFSFCMIDIPSVVWASTYFPLSVACSLYEFGSNVATVLNIFVT